MPQIAIRNIHCPSCVSHISSLLSDLPITQLSISIFLGQISFSVVPSALENEEEVVKEVRKVLGEAGFELEGFEEDLSWIVLGREERRWWDLVSWGGQERKKGYGSVREEEERRMAEEEGTRIHRESCKACQESTPRPSSPTSLTSIIISPSPPNDNDETTYETTILINGMTCSSCVSAVRSSLDSHPSIKNSIVTLLPGRAVIKYGRGIEKEDLVELIEEGGYEALLGETRTVGGLVETRFLIEGMTCSSCVNSLKSTLQLPGIRQATITLLPPLATIIHDPQRVTTKRLAEEIDDSGFGSSLVSSKLVGGDDRMVGGEGRKVMLKIEGMFCSKCSSAINTLLDDEPAIQSFTPLSISNPTTTLTYLPSPPDGFTLRSLKVAIESLGPFFVTPVRQSTILDQLSRNSQRKEARDLALRVFIAFLFSIPTFLIAILPSFLPSPSPYRNYLDGEILGSASRGTLLLWVLATPVQFGVGSLFYTRSWKGVRGVWRRGGERKWKRRFLRWGSMDVLVCLGTSTAYFSSLIFLILDILTPPSPEDDGISPAPMSYFDTCVILVLFILLGRLLEGIARRSTGEAIERLGAMAPSTAILIEVGSEGEGEERERTQTLPVDFLELTDLILIPPGSSVPLDSLLHSLSPSSTFDESSITGESLPILKIGGEAIIAGSINLGPAAVRAVVGRTSGEGLIDGIVESVRQAMGRKMGLERFADQVTSYFVPAIVGIALLTVLFWTIRGATGSLPAEWYVENGRDGNWVLFAVQFAVAVLVVACPCGIGLAVPSATMSATGIASRNGIVPYGGGEAFQNATEIDCVVFDKTGTLTTGSFKVVDHLLFLPPLAVEEAAGLTNESFWRVLEVVEETSLHPIAAGIRSFARLELVRLPSISSIRIESSEEIAGRGTKAVVECSAVQVEILVGNELFMEDNFAIYRSTADEERGRTELVRWAEQGKSVVLVAIRLDQSAQFEIVALFSVQDLPRPEAAYIVRSLQQTGIAVFICSGDNIRTARAVGKEIGLREEEVFAGVLPDGKREVVERLQRGAAKGVLGRMRRERGGWRRFWSRNEDERRTRVMFVGDGINDLLALTTADVGVSIGGGASIAVSSSDFCLLPRSSTSPPSLLSLLTLLSLASSTRTKIISNFIWACGFNVSLIPIAAGVFYDYGGKSLPPVWASAAMAASSITVLLNSLFLRWSFRPPASVRNYLQ